MCRGPASAPTALPPSRLRRYGGQDGAGRETPRAQIASGTEGAGEAASESARRGVRGAKEEQRERAPASEPRDRREPAKRRARARVGEFEGRSPSINIGGAGSCTRVRKYIPAGIYDAYPRLKCRPRREAAARTAGSQPRKISPAPSGTASVSQPAEMTSVPHPQAGEDGRSQVFTLRERAAYPQLGLFHLLTRVMVLGTHPAKPYLRRSWFAPTRPHLKV